MTAADPVVFLLDVDNPLRILAAMKDVLGNRLPTICPRQGHYALDPRNIATYPPADMAIEHIGELATWDRSSLLGAVGVGSAKRKTL